MPAPKDPERLKEMRTKLLEHLEASLAWAEEAQESEAAYLIEQALDWVRSNHWPALDPNLEIFRKGKR